MAVSITQRALWLIDESFGLDHYILKTDEVNLCSRLAMTLKRRMLQALASPDFCPDDPVRREKLLKKYNDYIIPAEEADWVGLPVSMAVEKAEQERSEAVKVIPLKHVYTADMAAGLAAQEKQEAK